MQHTKNTYLKLIHSTRKTVSENQMYTCRFVGLGKIQIKSEGWDLSRMEEKKRDKSCNFVALNF